MFGFLLLSTFNDEIIRERREREIIEGVWFLVWGSDGSFGGSGTLEGDFLNGLHGDMDFLMDCK